MATYSPEANVLYSRKSSSCLGAWDSGVHGMSKSDEVCESGKSSSSPVWRLRLSPLSVRGPPLVDGGTSAPPSSSCLDRRITVSGNDGPQPRLMGLDGDLGRMRGIAARLPSPSKASSALSTSLKSSGVCEPVILEGEVLRAEQQDWARLLRLLWLSGSTSAVKKSSHLGREGSTTLSVPLILPFPSVTPVSCLSSSTSSPRLSSGFYFYIGTSWRLSLILHLLFLLAVLFVVGLGAVLGS